MNELFSELKDLNKKKKIKKTITFNKIFTKCLRQIKFVVKNSDQKYLIYEIPHFIPGEPLINIPECSEFLVKKLTELGFDCETLKEHKIIVSWFGELKDIEIQEDCKTDKKGVDKKGVDKKGVDKKGVYKEGNDFILSFTR